MTCIVGLVDNESGKVFMGADSIGIDERGGSSINAYKKLFRVDDFLIGCSGSPRPPQLLQYQFKPPEYNEYELDEKDAIACYMVTKFIDALRECLDKAKLKDEDRAYLLVGFKGRLFGVYQDDYQVEESERGYNAIGIGGEIAMGSLYATRDVGYTPDFKVRLALEASAEHNAHVRAPFIIESI